MRADQVRGKPIALDMTVQTLFKQITELHPRLLEFTHEAEEKRTQAWVDLLKNFSESDKKIKQNINPFKLEYLADKVNMISDARTALNALREEHKQETRRRAEEAERQRQLLLAQKMELMRQKKREYLETQRQATLARMAENQAQLHVSNKNV